MPLFRHPILLAMLLLLPIGLARAQTGAPDSAAASAPQRDLMDLLAKVLGHTPKVVVDSHPPLVLSVLPAFSVNPAYGVLFGVATTALMRLGPLPETSASTAGVTVSYTTKQQFNVVARANIFGPRNQFLLQGDWRYQDTSQPTYGLGPALPEDLEDNLEYRVIRLYQTLFRPVSGQLMAGVGYHYSNYFDIVDPRAEQGLPSPVVDYNDGRIVTSMVSSGLSLNMVFDNRDSPIYATRGYYALGTFRSYPTWLGSDSEWQSFQTDFRTYAPTQLPGRGVFAVWATTWFTFGSPPYLELPAIGWDTYQRSGRGYPQGRVRGENQLYLEGEYRVALSPDGFWGAAAFVNLLATSDPITRGFEKVNPGVGLGLRIKLNKRSTTNITLDYAVGVEGASGLFLGTGEAF
jgi:hypothetical protein